MSSYGTRRERVAWRNIMRRVLCGRQCALPHGICTVYKRRRFYLGFAGLNGLLKLCGGVFILKIRKDALWVGLAVFTAFATACPGQALSQITGAAFLNNGQTPESSAMGGSGVVTSLGASALESNSAGLGMINNRFQVYSMYESPMEGVQYGQLSAAVGFNGRGWLPIEGVGMWGRPR